MIEWSQLRGQKILTWLFALALGAIFGAAIWMRVTSLKTAPVPTGDEAVYAVMAGRLVQGRSVSLWTASGHLLSPFLLALQIPLVWAFEPSYTVLRLPIAACGILTVFLTYVFAARALDRPTALIASGLLAVLPIAIIFSRIEWEPGLIPLWSVLCLYLAMRARRLALLGMFVVGVYFVHPTTLLLAPILVCVLTAALLCDSARPWVLRWRSVLVSAAGAAAVVLPIALAHRGSPQANWTRTTYHFGPADWGKYFTLFKNMCLGLCGGVQTATTPPRWQGWLFWGVVASVLVAGTWRLVRCKQWARLALVGSVVASALGLHLVEGPEILSPELVRYGIFLLVPSALAFACLVQSLLVVPATPRLVLVRNAQVAALLVMAVALLVCAHYTWFDVFLFQSRGRERFLTLPGGTIDPNQRVSKIILKDLDSWGGVPPEGALPGRDKHLIVTEDWWRWRPIQFFTLWRNDVKVVNLESEPPANRERIVLRALETGSYVVSVGNPVIDHIVLAAYPFRAIRHWHVQVGYHPVYSIYRLRRQGEPITDRCFCQWVAL
ncbi:MAG TPA: glycosyltransferase family 39 protein, partial [Isosphaeraceae bacterium]|nr:glycosyltransferase family 39 protein [Isosphaeraceae bacterium]